MNTENKKHSQLVLQDTVNDIGLMAARCLGPRNRIFTLGNGKILEAEREWDCGQQELRVTHTTEKWQGQTEGE